MNRPALAAAALAVAALTLAPALASAAAAPPVVLMAGLQYLSPAAAVTRGDSITFTNVEPVGGIPHTVTGGPLNSPLLFPGQSFTFTFTQPTGTVIQYKCVLHPNMIGVVVVV